MMTKIEKLCYGLKELYLLPGVSNDEDKEATLKEAITTIQAQSERIEELKQAIEDQVFKDNLSGDANDWWVKFLPEHKQALDRIATLEDVVLEINDCAENIMNIAKYIDKENPDEE